MLAQIRDNQEKYKKEEEDLQVRIKRMYLKHYNKIESCKTEPSERVYLFYSEKTERFKADYC